MQAINFIPEVKDIPEEGGEMTPLYFSGSAKDYFFICIRTFLLAIVTLGIYDAWGTVERRRYLLGHTKLDGYGFSYHARPKTILIGRIIAIALLVIWQILLLQNPEMTGFGTLVLLIFAPWLIVKALRFRTRNTAYRMVRFNFTGGILRSAVSFIILPLISFILPIIILMLFYSICYFLFMEENSNLLLALAVTFSGILLAILIACIFIPFVTRIKIHYVLNHLKIGVSYFAIHLRLKSIYKMMFVIGLEITFFLSVLFAIIYVIILNYFPQGIITAELLEKYFDVNGKEGLEIQFEADNIYLKYILSFLIFGFFYFLLSQYKVVVYNAMMQALKLAGGHGFQSTMKIRRYFWIRITNILAIIFSLGLLYPWTVIRFRRYQLSCTYFIANGSLDYFINHDANAGGAAAAELGAMEGVSDGMGDGIFG